MTIPAEIVLLVLGVVSCVVGGFVTLYSYRSLVTLSKASKDSTSVSDLATRVRALETGIEALNSAHISLQRKFSKRDLDERRLRESEPSSPNGTASSEFGAHAHLFERPE